MANFFLILIALVIIVPVIAFAIYTVYYHYRARRLGIRREGWMPPIPFFSSSSGEDSSAFPLSGPGGRSRSRHFAVADVDEVWDSRVGDEADYEGVRLQAQPDERVMDDAELDRRYNEMVDDEDDIEVPENPFGKGARMVEPENGKSDKGKQQAQ